MSQSLKPAVAVSSHASAQPIPPTTGSGTPREGELTHKQVVIGVSVFVVIVTLFAWGFYWQQQPGRTVEHSPATASPAIVQASESGSGAVPRPAIAPAVIGNPSPIESTHLDVYFDFGQSRLRADAIATLQEQVGRMPPGERTTVLITGSADHHGPAAYNRELAHRRGESVKQFLVELGVPAESIKVVSLGQAASLCEGDGLACQRLNRRVHLEVVKLPMAGAAPAASSGGPSEPAAPSTPESAVDATTLQPIP